ncbi:MAG: T9SS type A sorting domain-containing protein [Bacteroidales bacterium]|nr:T9SS type A sorting domain-containing protein [Bacteroidales bacterium]
MKKIIPLALLVMSSLLLSGQGVIGSWDDHLPYSRSNSLTAGGGKVYSSTGYAVLVHDIVTGTNYSLSRISGLTEASVALVAWCEAEESLVIVYRSTGIDIVRKGVITSIPDIKNKYIPGIKEIYGAAVSGSRVLLSGSFGIVVIDVRGRYVADTWRPGPDGETNSVNESVIHNGIVYAATAKGVWSAPLNRQGLSYFGNWDLLEELPSPGSEYSKIAVAGEGLMICKPGTTGSPASRDSLFLVTPGYAASLVTTEPGGTIKALDGNGSRVMVSLTSSLRILTTTGDNTGEINSYGWAVPSPVCAYDAGQKIWIADAANGLVSTRNFSEFSNHTKPGPYTANVADIVFSGNSFYVTGGTVDNAWGNVYRPLQVFTGSGGSWKSHILYGEADRDAMRVAADPDDENHFFVSSWGNGLYEFDDGEVVNNYNQYNSPLASIRPGEDYTRICGLAWDREGNLWMTHSGVPGNLKAITPDGNWIVTGINLNVTSVGDMVIDRNQFIWVILPRGNGLLVYDPGGTPANTSDDRYTRLQVQDTEGRTLNNLFSIATDLDGNVWVGTDMGPAVYYNPGKVFSSELKASRIRIPRNDGSGLADYLLGTETVTAIAVDGANRKWFGTISSGAYLMSDDARKELAHFNTLNSPLLSDNVVKIAVNGSTGEVWFGTAEGIISYRGEATTGGENFSGIYAFPNPVREDYEGVVTITGLVENSSVKITDVTGNLVFETTSLGGQAIWDLSNYKSQRVATGVYIVFCANEDGTLAGVTKVLVIR